MKIKIDIQDMENTAQYAKSLYTTEKRCSDELNNSLSGRCMTLAVLSLLKQKGVDLEVELVYKRHMEKIDG